MNGNPPSSGASHVSQDTQDDSLLDPRIYKELEKLNKASEEINCLEVELDNSRAAFRLLLNDSITQLNALSKRLGGCVDKARPYYDARKKSLEAQICTQNAAVKFEKACSQLAAAKEMVNLAEQGYFKMGQSFDPAWQEMLNHSTIRVNDAEKERLECEVAHKMTTFIFNEAEQSVRKLQKEFKRSISKSKPYFEMKAKFNQMMEDQKRKVERLESAVSRSKEVYSQSLKALESISDEIHKKRGTSSIRNKKKKKSRKVVVRPKRPDQIYHPLMDASEVVLEELSSSSPEERMVNELNNLHHFEVKNTKSSNNRISSNRNINDQKSDDISMISRSPSPPRQFLNGMGDAKRDLKTLYRPLNISGVKSKNGLPNSPRRIDPSMAFASSSVGTTKSFAPSNELSWNMALSPTKRLEAESSNTIFHAPLNPLRVESLSTDRVNQEMIVSDRIVHLNNLHQMKSHKLHNHSKKPSLEKAKKHKHAKDKNSKGEFIYFQDCSQNVQCLSVQCPERSSVETQKNLLQESHDPALNFDFKGAGRSVETEKRNNSLLNTEYTFIERKDKQAKASPRKDNLHVVKEVQTSYSLIERVDVPQQTSFHHMKPNETQEDPRVGVKGQVREELKIGDADSFELMFNSQHTPSRSSESSRNFSLSFHPCNQDLSQNHKATRDNSNWKYSLHNFQPTFLHKVSKESFHTMKAEPPPPPLLPTQLLPQGRMELSQTDANSETESIASSLNSANILDDEQIESLMMETGQYHNFLSQLDIQESDQYRRLTLPNKLRYLKNLVNFEPIWLDGCDEDDPVCDTMKSNFPFPRLDEGQLSMGHGYGEDGESDNDVGDNYEDQADDDEDQRNDDKDQGDDDEDHRDDDKDQGDDKESGCGDVCQLDIPSIIEENEEDASLRVKESSQAFKKVTFAPSSSLQSSNSSGKNTIRSITKNTN